MSKRHRPHSTPQRAPAALSLDAGLDEGASSALLEPPPGADPEDLLESLDEPCGDFLQADELYDDDVEHPEEAEEDPRRASLLRRVLQDRSGLLEEIAHGERPGLRGVVAAGLGLTALGGLGLGVASGPAQALAAAIKMPLISLLALVICFPAFYVFAALQGSRIKVEQALRMFAVGLGLRGAIVAGLAPLLLLVASVGSPYAFVLLMGLFVFGTAELGFLRVVTKGVQTLRRERDDAFSPVLLNTWCGVYLLVMVQLVWSFRPLIRHPSVQEFVLFGGQGNLLSYFLREALGLF